MLKGEIIRSIMDNRMSDVESDMKILTEEPLLQVLDDVILCELLYYWGRVMGIKVAANQKAVIFAKLGKDKDRIAYVKRRSDESRVGVVTKEDFPNHLIVHSWNTETTYDHVKDILKEEKLLVLKDKSTDIELAALVEKSHSVCVANEMVEVFAIEYEYKGRTHNAGKEELQYFLKVLDRVLFTLPEEKKIYIREEDY